MKHAKNVILNPKKFKGPSLKLITTTCLKFCSVGVYTRLHFYVSYFLDEKSESATASVHTSPMYPDVS